MKARVVRLDHARDVATGADVLTLRIEMVIHDTARSAMAALIFLGEADLPLDVEVSSPELVRAMSTEELERMLNDIMFELDDRST